MISWDLHKRFVFKSVRIRSYYGPHFPGFGLNTERFCKSSWLRHFKKNSSVRLTSKKCLFPLPVGEFVFQSEPVGTLRFVLIFEQLHLRSQSWFSTVYFRFIFFWLSLWLEEEETLKYCCVCRPPCGKVQYSK